MDPHHGLDFVLRSSLSPADPTRCRTIMATDAPRFLWYCGGTKARCAQWEDRLSVMGLAPALRGCSISCCTEHWAGGAADDDLDRDAWSTGQLAAEREDCQLTVDDEVAD